MFDYLQHDPLPLAVPFFFLLIVIEVWLDVRDKSELYEWKDSAASIAMGVGSAVVNLGMKTLAFVTFSYLYQFRLFDLASVWWVWLLLFFADDFTFYWHHRLSHEVRLLWAAHVNHHSSKRFNLSVALRQSWAELIYKYVFWLWLPLVGFHPLMILTMMSFSLMYQFWVHTEKIKSLGILEWVFNSPSHHRVHHASNPRYLDRNHAGTLIIWDRIFGTFQQELAKEKPIYGITENINTYNPFQIAFHEFGNIWNDVKKPSPLWHKLGYMFMPPGWSPTGAQKTAKAMQKEIREKEEREAA